ncbi:MAG: ABC transporter permease, partial [Candidatus Nomurabacteria bacterium]|nr:ABC transporter permease [Candidatus Nomurabacteria bacterium]
MKFWDIIKTANANLLRNKGRTFLTILAVFIGSFVIMLTTGMNAGVNNYIDKQLNAVGGNGYMDVAAGTDLTSSVSSGLGGDIETATKYDPSKDSSQTATISTDQIKKIRALSGVTRVEPFRWSSSSYITGGKTSDKFVMTNPQQSLAWTGMNVDLTAGRMPDENSTQPQITVEAKFVKALGYNSANDILGATVRVGVANSLTKKISEVSGTVVGVFNPSMVFGGRDWTNAAMFDKIFNASMAGMPAVYQNETSALGLTYDKNFTNEQVQNLKDQL